MEDYRYILDSSVYGPIIAEAHKILTFLDKVNAITSKRITQKWIFVDLFYLLYQHKHKLSKLNAKDFANSYVKFDQSRLEHNAEPEKLIAVKQTKEQLELYEYILAFKISGAERKNLEKRNQVLKQQFKSILEV